MLRKIYFKEMKDSFRDRRTLLLTVFLPIIMMTAFVFFYESMISGGQEGEVYNLAVDEAASEAELHIFSEFENIVLIEVTNPEEAVKNGEAHAAVVFEPNFIDHIQSRNETSVTIMGDSFSQKSSNLMGQVMTALSLFERTVVSERLLAEGMDQQLIEPFVINHQELSEEETGLNLLAMLIPLMLALAIGIGAGPSASDLFAGEKEKKTMEALLMTPVNRSTLLLSKWLTITSIGCIIGLITLAVVSLEIYFLTEYLKDAVSSISNIGLIIGIASFVAVIYAMLTASILMLTSIMAKTVKESQSYSTPVMMLTMFPVMFLTSIGVNELAFHHFAIPILNLFSILKELLVGVVDYGHLSIFAASNLIVMIVLFIIGRIMFMKDKWVLN